VENNCYYYDYRDRPDDGPSPEPDVTEGEIFVSGIDNTHCRHGVRDKLTDYWVTVEHLYTPFYGSMMKREQYIHTLSYSYFTDKGNEPDRTGENFDRLWKI
jgi:hypothetical protein